MLKNTPRSRFLDRQRRRLGVAGQIARDQTTGSYVLLARRGDAAGIGLGCRWRQALVALQARKG